MSLSNAWLLELNDSLSIAVGDHEMVECLQAPVGISIPGAPQYCNKISLWQEHLVPVMDVDLLLDYPKEEDGRLMSLLAYQEQPGLPLEYLMLKLKSAPRKIKVDDELVCELPEDISEGLLLPLCLTCFQHQDRPVLILDIAGLCSGDFRDRVYATKSRIFDRSADPAGSADSEESSIVDTGLDSMEEVVT